MKEETDGNDARSSAFSPERNNAAVQTELVSAITCTFWDYPLKSDG
jgi:hypothetical protein